MVYVCVWGLLWKAECSTHPRRLQSLSVGQQEAQGELGQ